MICTLYYNLFVAQNKKVSFSSMQQIFIYYTLVNKLITTFN